MEKCEYSNRFLKYPCNRYEEQGKGGFCIFHCDKEKFTDEEKKKFNEEFWKEFEKQEKDNNQKKFEFVGFKFPDGFSFWEKEFKKPVNFPYATFSGEANFSGATFSRWANFWGAKFSGGAYFRDAKFSGEANFGDATFSGIANFLDATFSGEAKFLDATFSGEASFVGATFSGEANFEDAKFTDILFVETEFKKFVNFRHTTFENSVRFEGGIKENGKETEINIAVFPTDKGYVDFSYAKFLNPKLVEFINVDLSRVSFLNFRLNDIMFSSDCKFNTYEGRKRLFDERVLVGDIKLEETEIKKYKVNYELIADEYREFRANYENVLRYVEAGDFYIGEMEIRRKNPKLFKGEASKKVLVVFRGLIKKNPKNFLMKNFSLTAFYKYFCNYGESYWRALLLIFVIIFLSALAWNSFSIDIAHIDKFIEKVKISALIFFQMVPPEDVIKDYDIFFVGVERILGIVFITLFVLAVRRKFKKWME